MSGGGFDEVLNGPVRFDALDRPGAATRIRLGATVIDVRHTGSGDGERVRITYEVGGRLYRLEARAVVLASGGWVNRHVVRDLPEEMRGAYAEFTHAPALVANVALRNWRFMAELGFTACRWLDSPAAGEGFGFGCSIRRPMAVGDYRAPLDPERPIVLTFYLGLAAGDLPLREQCALGRAELFETSFYEYERRLRTRLVEMFAGSGFDPGRDIAGIVLNRWGHARLAQPPGFYFGRDGEPSPREVVEAGFGRVAVGHSELNGHQNWTGGLQRGRLAVEQLNRFL
jgi:spermidine dehydrogenase